MILQVRQGPSPNCSSHGSVVGMALLSAAGAAVVLNVWADRFLAWTQGNPPPGSPPGTPPEDPVYREEEGGQVLLAFPDGQLLLDGHHADLARKARRIGLERQVPGALSAPVEAHLALTHRCPVACKSCYLEAGPAGPASKDLGPTLRDLAAQGVLQVAFGGGEVLLDARLPELLSQARALGMVPNFTTSGFGLNAELAARIAPHVGQVNVSLDGLAGTYGASRGWEGAKLGLKSIDTLVQAGVPVGVNTVLTRALWDNDAALLALQERLVQAGVHEWQWLRFKPAGRATETYAEQAPQDLERQIWTRLLRAEAAGLRMRIDCALVPFLPELPVDRLQRLGVQGCPGGHSLMTRSATGEWAPCSFVPGSPQADWARDATMVAWRERAANPPEPCGSCPRKAVCRGGCRAVSAFLTGDALAPDPECPRVRAHAAAPPDARSGATP
ncbi:MAG: radical SAM protein [Myxococcota bacterium]|nr:radical SAM protein [Myxococcota bacterium]